MVYRCIDHRRFFRRRGIMKTLLKIPTLAIKVPVYDRVSGSGQDIIDRTDSAVRFKQGPLTIICDHCDQANFTRLNAAVPEHTRAFIINGFFKRERYICTGSEIGHIIISEAGNRLYDSQWRHVYQTHKGLCIYTCMRKSADDVMDVRLTFWERL